MSHDTAAIRQALYDNYRAPEGAARNARAERLLAEAEGTGDTPLLIEALSHLLQAYNYSSERDKLFVPFARLLRLWDEQPGEFDEQTAHSLHWYFKWVSTDMLDQPHIPLASMEKWLGEMEQRYRLAGYSERAVRQGEFCLARHIGDQERAERAYAAWLAADRDRMADCHACELHDQGAWQARLGNDERALELWRPVLDGEYTCAHEPHAVLAASLLPLLRLGRAEEARAHHLRGYRMVRPLESMRGWVALHVEFCALTGNEARALEILSDRPAYFTDGGDPDSLMRHLAATAVLMDRLVILGHGEQGVPGPAGTSWTARTLAAHAREQALAIAARFDGRNGTDAVSTRVRERLGRQPLLERLPLGIRAVRPAPAAPPKAPASAQAPASRGVDELLAEARRLSEARHPDAIRAWDAVAEAAGDAELDDRALAEIDDHRAMAPANEPAESVRLFRSAAERYEAAGDPGNAVAALARGAFALALGGDPDAAVAAVEEPVARALALHAEGAASTRQAAGALLCRVRIHLLRLHDEDGAAQTRTVEEAVSELLDFAGPHRADPHIADRVAEAMSVRGDLAAHDGDAAAAAELYGAAAALFHEAGLPWYAAEPEARLVAVARHLGDLESAERAARAALEHGGTYLEAPGSTRLHLQLTEILAGSGRFDEAVEHALEAAHWADEAGEGAGIGAYARHQLGGSLLRAGRAAEAAAVLEAVLPDLTVDGHGDGMVVQTLWWLGDALTELGEPRAAAEHWLRAADIARGWPEQHDHAMLANLAGQALYRAGLNTEADRAYERACALWRDLGDVHAVVRALRVRAWIAVREGQTGPDAARDFMAAAERECEQALAKATEPPARARLRAELADTRRQTGELLADDPREALPHIERAITGFTEAGEDFTDLRTSAELFAAWLEADLGDAPAATRRAESVLATYADASDDTAESRRAEARSVLEYVA
ncbi:tetratricopeptide repeat protein [Streptomyces formicae]|uniref:Tetratricopeptide repeat protein n=1 Tax=Streptomyces formicae TaxID=1616117 RepID=A0ABY3WH67_9ACTN|nr:tetratricopeptide repeat protein [Streptomyces formicae]UNM11515.1 tetratricopeptide repeat protein [Streptomyces formicae]